MVDCTEFNSNARLTPIQFRPGEPTIGLDSDSLARLTEGELLLCPHKVPGYSLEKKRWGLFDVRNISDMIFDDYAFAQLVLSEDKKTLISSMVTTATLEDDHFDDFIKGKGKSLIFLLHGEPGVGKTYTAGMPWFALISCQNSC
jgi:hypothetical protein